MASSVTLERYLKKAYITSRSARQALSLGHLYAECFKDTPCRFIGIQNALKRIKEQLVYLSLERTNQPDNPDARCFHPSEAEKSYQRWYREHPLLRYECDSILSWLLDGDFTDDPLQKNCRAICEQEQINTPLLASSPDKTEKVSELGFGELVDDDWIHRHAAEVMLCRDKDIEKHLSFLILSLKRRKHYLLEGQPGVGKSLFIRKLLGKFHGQIGQSTEPALCKIRFVLFNRNDFIGREEDIRKRLDHLYDYLQQEPDIIPVFDGFEHLLNPSLGVYEIFSSVFGGIISGGGKTFVLICQTARAGISELLKNVRGVPLPALLPNDSAEIVKIRLAILLKEADIPLKTEISTEEFCHELVKLAAERYPNHYFPKIALDLAESSVNRAVSRSILEPSDSGDFLTLDDLRDHISEELNLNPEILGKDPKKFYQNIRCQLKQDVIGQDHVIDQVVKALELNAKSPPQRSPRGRFLFVGPPGVGKTELGRSLARRLGLGEESFFVFNMSEYSSETARTRFMGSDPGYVGFKSTQTIYDNVKNRPSCVILLDEIDRAHSSIHDILLSIFEGQGKDSEGNTVYFSQSVFVLTTNQGQEQVCQAYEDREDKTRDQLAKEFSDEALRNLLLKGVLDQTENNMKIFLQQKLDDLKSQFAGEDFQKLICQPDEDGKVSAEYLLKTQNYLQLKEINSRISLMYSKTTLDRALLDRIDFILPFFPIKEPELLNKILNIKLKKYGWSDISQETREKILHEAMEQQESVRPLERLIKKYMIGR